MLTWRIVHPDDDPIEHRYGWHGICPYLVVRTLLLRRGL
jgi:hypothetical protein